MSDSTSGRSARGALARGGFIVAGLCLAAWAALTQATSFGAVHAAAALWLAAAAHARWMPRPGPEAALSSAACTTGADGECLGDVLDAVMQETHPLARRHGIDLWLHAPAPAETLSRVADAVTLRAVLMGVIGHAIARSRHGRIDVSYEVQPEAAGSAAGQRRLRLWVRHGGPGLGPDPLRRSFAVGGSLAECRRHIVAMGGALMVHSDQQVGTVLRLALPIGPGEPAARAETPQTAAQPCA